MISHGFRWRLRATRGQTANSPHPSRLVRFALFVLSAVLLVVAASAAPSTVVPRVTMLAPRPTDARTGTEQVKPVGYWEGRFLQSWEYERENDLPQSRSLNSWDQYGLAYDLDANTAMFRATDRTRYLDRALEYVNNVAATARISSSLPNSQYRDGYFGWAAGSSGEVPLYESYFWRYVTTLLRVMRQSPAIYQNPAYRAQYDRLLHFTEVNIFDKWFNRDATTTIYRSRTHLAAHWAMIALNLSVLTTDPLRRARCRQVVTNIDLHMPNYPGSLRGQLRQNPVMPSAYFWNDVWGSFRRPGQDVSHGNGVIAYVVEASDLDTHWTEADMAGFSELLTRVIWPGGRTYRDYVDGSGSGNGWFSDGFVKLGRYDPAVQQRLEQHLVVNGQFAANMALNARVLS